MKKFRNPISLVASITIVILFQCCAEEAMVTVTNDGSPCPGIQTVTYAGKTYNTVLIGDDCWLKENLNVGKMIQSIQEQKDNGIIEKYCYNNDTVYCDTYGGLYRWDEAMQYEIIPGEKGICPQGWHIPTLAEFQSLVATVKNDGNVLKAIGQGSSIGVGTNTSGFSALLAGYCYSDGEFKGLGTDVIFRSSTEYDTDHAYGLGLLDITYTIYMNHGHKTVGFCVRCVKD